MTALLSKAPLGDSPEPMTLKLERLLPGPVERVWRYLTESDLRAQWLAAGPMELEVGGVVDLTWRNDDLTQRKEDRPPEFGEVHQQVSRVTRLDPPRLLAFGWAGDSEVTFELEPRGPDVLLTITHRRLPQRSALLGVSTGWHAHVDVLEAKLRGEEPPPFWRNFLALRTAYDARLPN